MTQDAFIQRLMVTFLGELEDHTRALERDLLALEKDANPAARAELFKTLFRTAHSLKGAARSVKVGLLESAGHRLEEVFAAARDGVLPIDSDFFALVLPAVDAIDEVASRLRTGRDLAGASLEDLVGRMGAALAHRPGSPRSTPIEAPAPPQSSEPGQWSGLVRVPAEKLDSLLFRSGELLSVAHRSRARAAEAEAIQEIVKVCRRQWRSIEKSLAALARRNGATPEGATGLPTSIQQRLEPLLAQGTDSLQRAEGELQRLVETLAADHRLFEQTAKPLDDEVHRTRMLPFSEACAGIDRMIRDLCAASGKKAELAIAGSDIEIDRSILEGLKDPLLHLVRNAVDHGIELPAARAAAGKPETGRISIATALRGARIEVTVADDGRGLDIEAIRERLRKSGLAEPESEADLLEQIFLAGFSTSAAVTRLSGRGIGLDIVKTRLGAMRGTVQVAFERGKGTRFTLSLPLTLTSIRAIVVGAADHVFAIDSLSVERILRFGADDIEMIEGREILLLDGAPVPIVPLTDQLGFPGGGKAIADDRKMAAVVLAFGNRKAAVAVGELLGEQEVMVRTLGTRLKHIRYVSGAALLTDGRVALILNAAELVSGAQAIGAVGLAELMAATAHTVRKRLLVVDDSMTIRALEKSILEAAGYDVMTAADGAEAWQILLEKGADLVVTDIEMPRMDGFSLTEAIRGSTRFRDLPVILMTGLETEADKARGLAAGADAYRVKSAFDQTELLATISEIL